MPGRNSDSGTPPNHLPAAASATAPPMSSTATDSDAGISSLSRLLLEGWTMLSTTCPQPNCHMPLARSPSNRVTCTSCNIDIPTSAPPPPEPSSAVVPHSGPDAPSSAVVPRSPAPAPPSSAVVPHVPAQARRRSSVSTTLGEKLLQGWTMLADACARCGTPLLRDASGTLLCVACSPERASDASPPPPGGPAPPPAQPLSLAAPREVSREVAAAAAAAAARRERAPQSSDRAEARAAAEGAGMRGLAALPAPPAAGGEWEEGSRTALEEIEATEAAVVAMLAELRARAREVRDVQAGRKVCEAIAAAADAIKKLREAANAIA